MAIGSVLNGGSEYVEGGGTAYSTTVSAGKLEVESGGSVDGGVSTLRLAAVGRCCSIIRQTFYQNSVSMRDLRMVTGWTSPILPSERNDARFRRGCQQHHRHTDGERRHSHRQSPPHRPIYGRQLRRSQRQSRWHDDHRRACVFCMRSTCWPFRMGDRTAACALAAEF